MLAAIQQTTVGTGQWPPGAIHDTVAAIARQPEFSQSIAQSLFGRFLQFIVRRISELFRFFNETPGARPFVIGATVLLVIAVVARIAIAGQMRDARRRGSLARGGGARHADPLAQAHALAAAGAHTEAAHALYVAVLQRMASRGWVRLHASKTGGDYARELRARGSPAYAAFRGFANRFDQVIYGLGVCRADDFNELLDRASSLLLEQRAA